MNQSYEWAKEITHFVNGGEVEFREHHDGFSEDWSTINPKNSLIIFSHSNFEFRIKPEIKAKTVAIFKNRDDKSTMVVVKPVAFGINSPWRQVSEWVEIEYEDDES